MIIAPDEALRSELRATCRRPSSPVQPTAGIVNGLQWIAQFATVPPTPSEHLIIQTNSAATAMQISQLLNIGLTMLQALPDQTPERMQSRAALAKLLAPHVNGDRVEINVDSGQVAELVRALQPVYMRGVQQQERIESMNHMRQISQAILMYRDAHKDQWPKTLKSTFESSALPKEALINPRDPARQPAYIYVMPKTPIASNT